MNDIAIAGVIIVLAEIIALVGVYAKGRIDGEKSAVNKSKAGLFAATLRK